MKNVGIILLSLLLAAVIFSGCAQTGAPSSGNNASQTTGIGVNSSNQSQTQMINAKDVSIKDYAFTPSTITVKAGDTVRWTNKDPSPHQIAGGFANSPVISSGGTYEFTFTTAGTYDYHCVIHPSMMGRVIVQ